jgi:hypothetical protein
MLQAFNLVEPARRDLFPDLILQQQLFLRDLRLIKRINFRKADRIGYFLKQITGPAPADLRSSG